MKAQFTLPSEVAREWVNRRWSKPNAKQAEARRQSQLRIRAARVDGDLAMLAVALGETFKLARAVYGQRQRLLDDRPLAGRETTPLGGGWEVGKPESRGTTFHSVLSPSEKLALECFGMEEETWQASSVSSIAVLVPNAHGSRLGRSGTTGESKKKPKRRKRRKRTLGSRKRRIDFC